MLAGVTVTPLAYIPSPAQGVWHLGPVPLRAYALFIVLGIVIAVWWGGRRWVARGGREGDILDIAIWAVPFGLIGGRLYHVITDNQLYFGPGKNPMDAFLIWEGGLGIWGAVALGALGAWIGARRSGVLLPPVADAIAPGIVAAQANNGLGIAGVGGATRVLPVRVLGKCGGFDSDIIAGMRWAAGLTVPGVPANPNPARVINLSLAGGSGCSSAYASAIAETARQAH